MGNWLLIIVIFLNLVSCVILVLLSSRANDIRSLALLIAFLGAIYIGSNLGKNVSLYFQSKSLTKQKEKVDISKMEITTY